MAVTSATTAYVVCPSTCALPELQPKIDTSSRAQPLRSGACACHLKQQPEAWGGVLGEVHDHCFLMMMAYGQV